LLPEGLSRILEQPVFVWSLSTNMRNLAADLPVHEQTPLLVLESAETYIDETVAQIGLFKEKHPTGRVAVLTDTRRAEDTLRAFQAGANVYLSSSVAPDAFVKALELVMLGETIMPTELLSLRDKTGPMSKDLQFDRCRKLRHRQQHRAKTVRGCRYGEQHILRYLVEGASNKTIAGRMNIAEATVKGPRQGDPAQDRSRQPTQAAIWAINNGARG